MYYPPNIPGDQERTCPFLSMKRIAYSTLATWLSIFGFIELLSDFILLHYKIEELHGTPYGVAVYHLIYLYIRLLLAIVQPFAHSGLLGVLRYSPQVADKVMLDWSTDHDSGIVDYSIAVNRYAKYTRICTVSVACMLVMTIIDIVLVSVYGPPVFGSNVQLTFGILSALILIAVLIARLYGEFTGTVKQMFYIGTGHHAAKEMPNL